MEEEEEEEEEGEGAAIETETGAEMEIAIEELRLWGEDAEAGVLLAWEEEGDEEEPTKEDFEVEDGIGGL